MNQGSDDNEMIMSLRDWRLAVRTPTTFRVGNRTLRIQTQFVTIVSIIGLVVLFILYTYGSPHRGSFIHNKFEVNNKDITDVQIYLPDQTKLLSGHNNYNFTYPLTPPITTKSGIKYRIGIVTDLDQLSKSPTEDFTWISYLMKGYLSWDPHSNIVMIKWDDSKPVTLKSTLGESGRGMELSELVVFNGKMYVVDDRTGVIFELENDKVIPWVVLMDGDGRIGKGFKAEWAAVKHQKLYIGGLGKEWTTHSGEIVNYNPQWVKTVSVSGEVNHLNWRDKYLSLQRSLDIEYPGYVSHEAAVWSDVHSRWFFLPRRCTGERYNPDLDEQRGCNVILSADEDFIDIKVTRVGELIPTHGFSSFRFIPGTSDQIIVALKSVEDKGLTATYITAFNIQGIVLLEETKVADIKYEGLEFL